MDMDAEIGADGEDVETTFDTTDGEEEIMPGEEGDEEGDGMDDEDMELGDEEGGEEAATKDDVMDLKDMLDEILAQFQSEQGEEEGEEEEEDSDVMEAVEMKKVSVTHTDGADSGAKKSTVAANSGKSGMQGSPVKFSGDSETVPTSPKGPSGYATKGEGKLPGAGSFQNAPGGARGIKDGKGESAPKPKTETVKSHSVLPESRKITKRRV
jgi:hypothetical protein